MGMYVSRLRSVPIGRYEYYAYLVDASQGSVHSAFVDRFFDSFASQSSVDAVIVRGPEDLSDQLYRFLMKHSSGDFARMEALFERATCLVISEGALQSTLQSVHVLPLLPREAASPEQTQFLEKLLVPLLHSMRDHRLTEFVQSLGAESIALSEIRGGMLVATLRRLNEALELKPNIAGLGLNLNAVIQRALGAEQRPLHE